MDHPPTQPAKLEKKRLAAFFLRDQSSPPTQPKKKAGVARFFSRLHLRKIVRRFKGSKLEKKAGVARFFFLAEIYEKGKILIYEFYERI